MTKSSLAIAGTDRLADELLALARASNREAISFTPGAAVSPSIEAIIETDCSGAETKRAHLVQIEALVPPSCLIMTSCLRLTATEIASWLKRPERLVGFATFYPLKDRNLIELTAGLHTSESALTQADTPDYHVLI